MASNAIFPVPGWALTVHGRTNLLVLVGSIQFMLFLAITLFWSTQGYEGIVSVSSKSGYFLEL